MTTLTDLPVEMLCEIAQWHHTVYHGLLVVRSFASHVSHPRTNDVFRRLFWKRTEKQDGLIEWTFCGRLSNGPDGQPAYAMPLGTSGKHMTLHYPPKTEDSPAAILTIEGLAEARIWGVRGGEVHRDHGHAIEIWDLTVSPAVLDSGLFVTHNAPHWRQLTQLSWSMKLLAMTAWYGLHTAISLWKFYQKYSWLRFG